MRFQIGEECVICFGLENQVHQRFCVPNVEIAQIIFTEQPDIPGDFGSDNRRASDNRLGDYVCSAFQAGRMDSQLAALQYLPHAPVRLFTEPAITRIDFHLPTRAFSYRFCQSSADMNDLDARRLRQESCSHCGAEGVFDWPEVADNTNLEIADCGLRIGGNGLTD